MFAATVAFGAYSHNVMRMDDIVPTKFVYIMVSCTAHF